MNDFVALDVERVGSFSRRPLQLGLAEVADGRVTRRLMRWVRTPGHPWACVTTSSRGMIKRGEHLTREVYESAPFLPNVWPEIDAFVDGRTLVAHQASGDIAALRLAFDDLGLPWPRLTFACSYQLARAVWPHGPRRGHKLSDLAAYLFPEAGMFTGYRAATSGHDPVEDAEAVARVVLAAQQTAGGDTLARLIEVTGWRLRRVEPDRCESSKGWVDRLSPHPARPKGCPGVRTSCERRSWNSANTGAAIPKCSQGFRDLANHCQSPCGGVVLGAHEATGHSPAGVRATCRRHDRTAGAAHRRDRIEEHAACRVR